MIFQVVVSSAFSSSFSSLSLSLHIETTQLHSMWLQKSIAWKILVELVGWLHNQTNENSKFFLLCATSSSFSASAIIILPSEAERERRGRAHKSWIEVVAKCLLDVNCSNMRRKFLHHKVSNELFFSCFSRAPHSLRSFCPPHLGFSLCCEYKTDTNVPPASMSTSEERAAHVARVCAFFLLSARFRLP